MKQLKYCKYDEKEKILVSNESAAEFEKPISFGHFLLEQFDKHGDKPFLTEEATGATMTFKQAKKMSMKIASSFINRLSLERGDVLFGYAFTSSTYCCAMLACNLSGLVFQGEPPRLSPVSVVLLLNDSKAKVVLCIKESLPRILIALEQCPSVRTVILMDASEARDDNNNELQVPNGVKLISLDDLIASGDANDPQLPRIPENPEEDQLLFLPYSSGSTGLPKGLKTCANSMINCCLNLRFRGLMDYQGGIISFCQTLGHSSGLLSLIPSLYFGCHLIVMPELNIQTLLRAIDKYKVACSFLPPTQIQKIAKMQHLSGYDLSSIESVSTGGAPLVASIVDDFLAKFSSKAKMVNSYGLSEGMVATAAVDDADGYKSVGSLVQGVEMKVVHPYTNQVCSFNEVGEIYMRSNMSASGYLNRPEAEAETWVGDGWIRTGDAGYYNEDGLVYIVDRYKEMIKVHINQVAPAELEAVLAQHPQVNEACVVAAPHPETGETPRAFVVPQDFNNLPDEDDIVAFVNNQMVEYRKIKGGLFLVESLPKISIGKFNRQLMKKNPEKLIYLNAKRKPTDTQ